MSDALFDSPRLLALRSEIGYVERSELALPDEPEAVSSAEQRYLTRQAERTQRERERATWRSARGAIDDALTSLQGASFASSQHDIRAIRRLVERIDRRAP